MDNIPSDGWQGVIPIRAEIRPHIRGRSSEAEASSRRVVLSIEAHGPEDAEWASRQGMIIRIMLPHPAEHVPVKGPFKFLATRPCLPSVQSARLSLRRGLRPKDRSRPALRWTHGLELVERSAVGSRANLPSRRKRGLTLPNGSTGEAINPGPHAKSLQ